jgi:hypothetical protein
MPENYLNGKTAVPFEVRDHRKKGFFQLDNSLIDDYGATLGVHGIAVYAVLAMHANKQEQAWPSLRTIAKTLDIGLSTVQRSINHLLGLGLIAREHRKSPEGDYTSNSYALLTVHKPAEEGVPGENIPVPQENRRVYSQQVHGVPGENTEQYPLNNTQKEQDKIPPSSPPRGKAYSAGFLTFWERYPVKQAKDEAWRVWQRQHLEPHTETICLSITAHELRDRAWKDGYIKYPASFLRQGCWKDELPEVAAIPAPANPYDPAHWHLEEVAHDHA